MAIDIQAPSAELSGALAELARDVARGVVLVRGSRGSSGSGVMWNVPGLVVTNDHVVPGPAAELVIGARQRLPARVVARAPWLDLAALEVERDARGELPPGLAPGDSDSLRVGDLVVAIGNPMGERNAPSLGIVAGAPGDVLRLAITLRPGNSGGALVNARGQVVGIPHMVTGSGLALAVSTRTVQRFLAGGSTPQVEADALRWI